MTTIDLTDLRCPGWCSGEHARTLEEGCSLEDAATHRRPGGGAFLPELRNAVDGRVERPGGGGYDLTLTRQPMMDNVGFIGPAVVEVSVHSATFEEITLNLTTGEARVLAAKLLRLAELEDQ